MLPLSMKICGNNENISYSYSAVWLMRCSFVRQVPYLNKYFLNGYANTNFLPNRCNYNRILLNTQLKIPAGQLAKISFCFKQTVTFL